LKRPTDDAERVVTAAIPAATVVLLRDGIDGLETLLARRNGRGAFGGYWVFPGGQVDAEDGEADDIGSSRRAGVREVREEVGLVIPEDSLVAFSHWVPPASAPKRFSTWFFVAPIDAASTTVVIDDSEIVDFTWMRPREAIRRRDAGEMELAPPTWVTLWRLAQSPDVAAALARATEHEPERFNSVFVKEPPGPMLLQPGDAGWESRDAGAPGARHRLFMDPAGWRYERDIDQPREATPTR
jgi:8-oxo-dGTP pyrophosphatase MutT (NUDIX family)